MTVARSDSTQRSAKGAYGSKSSVPQAGTVCRRDPVTIHGEVWELLRVTGGAGLISRTRSSFASASRSPGHSASTSRQSFSVSA